jgi:galactokinase
VLKEADVNRKFIEFEARFGRGGEIDVYFAPGRINLIGDHTDYNGGLVLPLAIQQGNYMMIRRSELPPARLYSATLDREARFHPSDIKKAGDWADYVRGVFLFAREYCENLAPFDAIYFGDLPLGAGLSSSASIELITALGLESAGCKLTPTRAVSISRRAENDFVGMSCGVMDQFSIAFAKEGNALLLDCDTMEFRQIPFNIKDTSLVIGHTGVYRSLLDSPYNDRRRECEQALGALSAKIGEVRNLSHISVKDFERHRYSIPEKLARRAEHVIFENLRVEEAARSLERGEAERLGHLMNRSHESLRDLFEASSPELDALQEISVGRRGVLGCRMTGGGFGGCVITLIETGAVKAYLSDVPQLYWDATHYEPEFTVTYPAEGARKLMERT